jgi:hypothetical protein
MTRGRLAELSGRTRTLLGVVARYPASAFKEKGHPRKKEIPEMKSTTALRAMTLTVAGLLVLPTANAVGQTPSAPPSTAPGPSTAPENIPDKKLDAATAAVKNVSAVKDTFDQRVAKAPASEKERLTGEAEHAMTKAVTDQGLSVEEYVAIMKVAQNDPIVRDKLIKRMK